MANHICVAYLLPLHRVQDMAYPHMHQVFSVHLPIVHHWKATNSLSNMHIHFQGLGPHLWLKRSILNQPRLLHAYKFDFTYSRYERDFIGQFLHCRTVEMVLLQPPRSQIMCLISQLQSGVLLTCEVVSIDPNCPLPFSETLIQVG